MPTLGSRDQVDGYNGVNLPRGVTDALSSSLRAGFQRCGSVTQLLIVQQIASHHIVYEQILLHCCVPYIGSDPSLPPN